MKTKNLSTENLWKLLIKFALPSVIAMIVNAIYNIVDRIFVGQYVGEHALASLSIVFPVMLVLVGFSSLIAQGGGNLISIALGKKDLNQAKIVLGGSISLVIIMSIFILLLGYLNMDFILNALGAEGSIYTYGYEYMEIIYMGIVFQLVAFVLNTIARAEGFPGFAMMTMIVSAVVNIVLDYIFIGVFEMGVGGAALATIIGQFSGFVLLTYHFLSRRTSLRIKLSYLKINFKLYVDIILIGLPTFVIIMSVSVAMVLLNKALDTYGGVGAVASLAAINSLYTLFIMPINGISTGMQPIIGYNYGARLYDRAKKTFYYALIIGISFSTIIFILLEVFPATFISLFIDSESPTMEVAIRGLRIFILCLPFLSINIFASGFFQATAKSIRALVLGALRQFVLLIPAVLILPVYFDLDGVWLASPVADYLSVLISVLMIYRGMKYMYKEENNL
jgi:putative MATE family efflux protein